MLVNAVRGRNRPLHNSANVNQVVIEAGVDLRTSNVEREIRGRKIEDLISGVDRTANSAAELDVSAINQVRHSANANTLDHVELVNKIAQLDVGSLINAGAQGQEASQPQSQWQGQSQSQRPAGPSDINTSNIAADLANQVAAGNRPTVGTGDINTSNVGADLTNQIAGFGTTPAAQGQTPGSPVPGSQAQPAPQAQAAEASPPVAEAESSRQDPSQKLRPAGPSDINTSNVAGDLANQLAPGLSVNGQSPASNDIAGNLANQIAGGDAAPLGEGQLNSQGQVEAAGAQSGSAGVAVIEIKKTIIQEANGQRIQTAVIEQQAQGQPSAAMPVPTEAPVMAAPQAPAPAAEAKPTEAPAVTPVSAEPQSNSTAAEAAPKPEAELTQLPAEGMSAMVRGLLPGCVYALTSVTDFCSSCSRYDYRSS